MFGTHPLLYTMNSPTETNVSSTVTPCGVSSIVTAQIDQTYSKDFLCLPIPRRLRYDPDKPFYFGMLLNVSFGIGSTFGEPWIQGRTRFSDLPDRIRRSCCQLVLLSANSKWVSFAILICFLNICPKSSIVGFFPCHVWRGGKVWTIEKLTEIREANVSTEYRR